MRILKGERVKNVRQAAGLAFHEARVEDVSPDVVDLFASATDSPELGVHVEKSITNTVRGRYGKSATWTGKWWYIPVPVLGYDGRGTPRIIIELKTFPVAPVAVDTAERYFPLTLIGPVGGSETLVVPMIFLRAMLDGDLDRFALLARSGGYTTWEIPGAKPIELPDDIVARLSETLRRKSVARWLEDFGSQGKSIVPLVVGSLLGLQFMKTAEAPSADQQRWTEEQLLGALETMAYPRAEAREMIRRAAPSLRADHTLEEAIRMVLQNTARGG